MEIIIHCLNLFKLHYFVRLKRVIDDLPLKNLSGERIMAKETILTNFTLRGREILSSYAAYTIEGVMTARVKRGRDSYTIEERNGIAKGTSDGENEAIYIENDKAIKSIEKI
jgi:hypothetical protein